MCITLSDRLESNRSGLIFQWKVLLGLCRHYDYYATVIPSTRVFRTSGRWPSFVRRWKLDLDVWNGLSACPCTRKRDRN